MEPTLLLLMEVKAFVIATDSVAICRANLCVGGGKPATVNWANPMVGIVNLVGKVISIASPVKTNPSGSYKQS